MPSDLDEDEVPYLAIAARLRAAIADGTYPPGSKLPSITRLAQEYDVAKSTAQRALKVLVDEGIATGRAGWGTFVTRDANR